MEKKIKNTQKEMLKKEFKDKIDDFRNKASALQKAVAELKGTGINETVLYYAIQRASTKYYTRYNPIGIAEIKAILQGLEGIESYLFPEEE